MKKASPTKTDLDRALMEVFGNTRQVGGWDGDSIALGFAMACGVRKDIFDAVHRLRGRPVPWDDDK